MTLILYTMLLLPNSVTHQLDKIRVGSLLHNALLALRVVHALQVAEGNVNAALHLANLVVLQLRPHIQPRVITIGE